MGASLSQYPEHRAVSREPWAVGTGTEALETIEMEPRTGYSSHMQDHHKLDVWVKAVTVAEHCYAVTRHFPESERYVLTTQMRRAAVSIASNIAEGRGRGSDGDFARFLRIAYASACELDTQAHIALRTDVGRPRELRMLIKATNETRRMLNALIQQVARPGNP